MKRRGIFHNGVFGLGFCLTLMVSVTLRQYEQQEHEREIPDLWRNARISPYDEIIQKYAIKNRLDWRLIASIIHVESHFQAEAISPKGAQGLMQIMPVVAEEQNIMSAHNPEQNILAGTRHFQIKSSLLTGKTIEDMLQLSLAAYNAGLGHVRDAQRLARKRGTNPRRWKDVAKAFLLLEKPDYFEKAQYGYCQGTAIVRYVSDVMKRYDKYCQTHPFAAVLLTETSSSTKRPST